MILKQMALHIVSQLGQIAEMTTVEHLPDAFGEAMTSWLAFWQNGAQAVPVSAPSLKNKAAVAAPTPAATASDTAFITSKEVMSELGCHQAVFHHFLSVGWLVPHTTSRTNMTRYDRATYEQHRANMALYLEHKSKAKRLKDTLNGRGTPLMPSPIENT